MVTLGKSIMIGVDCASSITRNVLFLDMSVKYMGTITL